MSLGVHSHGWLRSPSWDLRSQGKLSAWILGHSYPEGAPFACLSLALMHFNMQCLPRGCPGIWICNCKMTTQEQPSSYLTLSPEPPAPEAPNVPSVAQHPAPASDPALGHCHLCGDKSLPYSDSGDPAAQPRMRATGNPALCSRCCCRMSAVGQPSSRPSPIANAIYQGRGLLC